MRRVLVTGATGRIGSHLIEALLEETAEVRALCLPGDPRIRRLRSLGVEVVEGSLGDDHSVEKAIRSIDDVFHLGAALTSRGAPKRDIVNSIAKGTFNIISGVRNANTTGVRLLLVSSTSVYYSGSDCPYPGRYFDESSTIAPSTPYGAAKRTAELLVQAAAREELLEAVIIRPCDTAGREEILEPTTVFGRRWFVSGALAWFERTEAGEFDRVSHDVYECLMRSPSATLFYLSDSRDHEPITQINDARCAARLLADIMKQVSCPSVPVFNVVPAQAWPMGAFVKTIAGLLGLEPAESVLRIEVDEGRDQWLFGTAHGNASQVPDVLTALQDDREA